MQHIDMTDLERIIAGALAEDIGDGDLTTLSTIPADARLHGVFLAKAGGIVAGIEVAREVFRQLDPAVVFTAHVRDGDPLQRGQRFAEVAGPGRALLTGERTALNFLQRMSGIATARGRYRGRGGARDSRHARRARPEIGGQVTDRVGEQNDRTGCTTCAHQDNHIAAWAASEAVRRVRSLDRGRPIEVEVTTLDQLREADTPPPVDRIMLDNMDLTHYGCRPAGRKACRWRPPAAST